MRVVSVFSGVGGFDLAFERAGCEIVAQIENDPACQTVLRHHWPDIPLFSDVCAVSGDDLPEFDILVGGFPCQDLSVAGARAGLQGERSGLFFEFARLVKETQPEWWLIENVPGLLSSHRGRDMGTLLRTMGDLGYWWAYRCLDAQFFGVPQRRRRIFIVGNSRNRHSPRQVLLEPEGRRRDPPKGRTTRSAAPVTRALTESFGTGGADLAHAEAGWIGAYPGTVGTLQAHSAGSGYRLGADEVAAGHVVPVVGNGTSEDFARCVTTGTGRRYDPDTETLVPVAFSVYPESGQGADLRACEAGVSPTLGAETLAKQAERGLHIVQAFPVASRGRDGEAQLEVGPEGTYNTLMAGNGSSSRRQLVLVNGKKQAKLHIVPLHLAQANDYVTEHHRHHKKTLSHKFSLGVATEDGELVGVAIVGRPVARRLDDGLTLEVNRTCTDGTSNANSCLYGAAWRVAREMGYHRLITYTQEGESGASLRGAGWRSVAVRDARGDWAHHSKSRGRDPQGTGGVARILWEMTRDRPAVFRKATKAHFSGDWERWEETDRVDTVAAGGATQAATAVVEAYNVHAAYSTAMTGDGNASPAFRTERSRCLDTGGGYAANQGGTIIRQDLAVRRLTPLECERLQGFPDGHTLGQVDSQRYRQLGNAVAVPVAEWIARRLVAVAENPPKRSRSWLAGGVRYAGR